MKKIAIIVGAVALASISTSIAQTTAPAPTPVRQLDDAATPSLVTDLTVKTNDSPLVRAAKAAAANRRRATGVVINDSYVKSAKGRLIEMPKLAPLPKFDDETTDVEAKAKAPIVVNTNRAVEQKKKLKEEQARRAEEMDDPYGDPDAAAQRMHEIEQEQKQESSKPPKSQNVAKRP